MLYSSFQEIHTFPRSPSYRETVFQSPCSLCILHFLLCITGYAQFLPARIQRVLAFFSLFIFLRPRVYVSKNNSKNATNTYFCIEYNRYILNTYKTTSFFLKAFITNMVFPGVKPYGTIQTVGQLLVYAIQQMGKNEQR